MPEDHLIRIETPDQPPDLTPQLAEVRERLARLEAHREHTDPAASESLSLASEARQLVGALEARLTAVESAVANVPAQVESASQDLAEEVERVAAPPPIPDQPPAVSEPVPQESQEHHHPWWHPMRYL